MGSFEANVVGHTVEAKLVGYLTPDEFEGAMAIVDHVPKGGHAMVDLGSTAYLDSFKALILNALLDRVDSCTFYCRGHIREALQSSLGTKPDVSFEEP